jgi:hypothetical protein
MAGLGGHPLKTRPEVFHEHIEAVPHNTLTILEDAMDKLLKDLMALAERFAGGFQGGDEAMTKSFHRYHGRGIDSKFLRLPP